jgi:serine protease
MRVSLILVALISVALTVSATWDAAPVRASEPDPIAGDADCDLAVDPVDGLRVLESAAGGDPGAGCLEQADVNCDGAVDVEDLTGILRHVADLPPGDVPGDCSQIGWAAGLPPLVFAVEPSIDTAPRQIAGVDGGPPRPLAALVDDDGTRSLFVENELVIATDSVPQLNALLDRWGATLVLSIDPSVAGIDTSTSLHLVRLDPSGFDTNDLADDLRALNDVSSGDFGVSSEAGIELLAVAADEAAHGFRVDLNWVAEEQALDQRNIADSPTGPTLWSPNPFDWAYMKRGGNQDIGVADAWRALAAASRLGNRVHVSIMDGGFAPNDDFPEGYDLNGPPNVANPASCTGGSSCPWHGTIVTAAAMGVPGNGYGVAGPAGPIADASMTQSPSLDLVSILRYLFSSLPQAVFGLPEVLNISAGVAIPRELCLTGLCEYLEQVAAGVRALDVLVVAAAMNDGQNVDEERCVDLYVRRICYEKRTHLPCELVFVICVGGLAWDSRSKDPVSNYGTDDESQSVDIFGPLWQFTTPTPDSGIQRTSCGTSCASPFVAGVAALIKAAHLGRNANDMEEILLDTAHTGSPDDRVNRWVNAYAAVIESLGGNNPPELSITSAGGERPGGIPMQLTAAVTDPEDRPSQGVPYSGLPEVEWASSLDGNLGASPFLSGVLLSYGTHVISATATDSSGFVIQDEVTLTIVNHPPEVNIVNPLDQAQLYEGLPVTLRGESEDLNRVSGALNDAEVQWFRAPTGDPANRTLIGNGHERVATFSQGDYILTFVGTDDQGASDEDSIAVTVLPPPVDLPPTAQITSPSSGSEFGCGPPPPPYVPTATLTGQASDPEDGTLTGTSLVWTKTVSGVTTTIGTGTSVQMSFAGIPKNTWFTVTLTATDSNNNIGTDSITLRWDCIP